ncbi:MAG: TldD/PmbA family protein [Acidobacteriota bacterium]
MSELIEVAQLAVKYALEAGATEAECTLSEGEEFSVGVRMREVEKLTQAGSRGMGIRVLKGQHVGSSRTSDLTSEGIQAMVKSALELAAITNEDPFAGLPEPGEFGKLTGDLRMYDDAISKMEAEWKIAQAVAAEDAALTFDPRIVNSEGGSFDSYLGQRAFANSRGFSGSYRTSSVGISAVPIAKDETGHMERDYWSTSSREAAGLETPESVGRKAAERAIRRLGARKVPTQKVPVIFEARTARSLLGDIFEAVNGSSIYRQASFLAGKLGEKIASEHLTVVDDATIPGLFGTSPFDDEGVPSRRTVVIEKGVLKSYLLNTYTARKLGLKTTGNASRGLAGNASVGPGNFYLEAGRRTEQSMIAGVKQGLFITELVGGDANTVTGDFSSGAVGMWIENGELAYPVSEITVAGNLIQMLLDLEEPASNLEFRSSIASPTLMIPEMTVSGQ